MEEKLEAVYKRLQTLNILPTKENMEKLLQSLYDIREVYNKLMEGKANGGHNGPEADPEG